MPKMLQYLNYNVCFKYLIQVVLKGHCQSLTTKTW